MSCCNNSTCTCDACVSQSAFASPLGEVSTGTNLAVIDRNGNPKALLPKDYSIPNTFEGGKIKNRTGESNDPINLKHLQTLLNGNTVLVKNGSGVIGVAVPTAENTYLAYIAGALQFVSTIPRSNAFQSEDIIVQSGKLAIFGCSSQGESLLGVLTGDGDYLSIVDGVPSAKFFCDAETTNELDSIFGCHDGVIKKILPSEGFTLVEEDSKWVVKEATTGEQWVGGADIWSKTYSTITDVNFALATVPFGAGVPATAEWVQIRVTNYYVISTQYGTGTIHINGIPIIKTRAQGSYASHQGSACLYIPYGTGSFTVRGDHVNSNSGSATAVGQLAIGVLSYK